MRIDHVTVAGRSLDAMRNAFARVGLPTEYGGPHSNGVTHMAQRSFDDGSYVELISKVPGATGEGWWASQIAGDAGPCAWAVVGSDLTAERRRLEARGIRADGPHRMSRRRPDGVVVEWELLFPGTDPPGATLPFIIRDLTPRSLRVPSSTGSKGAFTGVDTVVIAVADIQAAVTLFRQAYDWPPPSISHSGTFGATYARFSDAPVAFAAPATDSSPLTQRIARYGDSPCALLIGSTGAAAEPSPERERWLLPGIGLVKR